MTVDDIKEFISKITSDIYSAYYNNYGGLNYNEKEVKEIVDKRDKILSILDDLDNNWVDVRDGLPTRTDYYEVTIKTTRPNLTYVEKRKFNIKYGWKEEKITETVIAWREEPKPYERKE